MKLKYYLRGMGIGIILTAIVMGFALGGRKATISDAEVIRRAKELGMIEAGTGVLSQNNTEAGQNNEKTDTSSSDSPLGKTGEKIPEENNQEITGADQPASDLAGEEEEGQDPQTEEGGSEAESPDDDAQGYAEVQIKTSDTAVNDETASDTVASAETGTVTEPEQTETPSETETAQASTETDAAEKPAEDTQTAAASGQGKTVTIPGGLGSEGVAAILAREGVIDDATAFNKYLVDRRVDRIIRSGIKTIPAGASYEQIADIITK